MINGKASLLLAVKALLTQMSVPGAGISHCKMGSGIIEGVGGDAVSVRFEDESVKRFNLLQSAAAGFISIYDEGFDSWREEYSGVLSSRDEIMSRMDLVSAELEGLIALLC